jgi:hypothetical protein
MIISQKKRLAAAVFGLIAIVIGYWFFTPPQVKNMKLNRNPWKLWKGYRNARRHCTGCHLMPQPQEFGRHDWLFPLSYMGLYLGIKEPMGLDMVELSQFMSRKNLLKLRFLLPNKQSLEQDDWYSIMNYYLLMAPDEAELPASQAEVQKIFIINHDTGLPKVEYPTLLHTISNTLYIGSTNNNLYTVDLISKTVTAAVFPTPPVHVQPIGNRVFVYTVGDLRGDEFNKNKAGIYYLQGKAVIDKLPRSAGGYGFQDNNQELQFLYPAFGVPGLGGLKMLSPGPGSAVPRIKSITNAGGTIKVLPLPGHEQENTEFLAAQADGDEKVLYWNRHSGELRTLYRFPPTTGIVDMMTIDLNEDQNEELIVVAGDNFDAGPYSPRKITQGAYIFAINRTGESISLNLLTMISYPGAYCLVAGDWNGDSIMDLGIGSFFPDTTMKNVFTLLIGQHHTKLEYKRQQAAGIQGRISRCTALDYDQDGDQDILLGRTAQPYTQRTCNSNKCSIKKATYNIEENLLLLENTTK